MNKEKVLEKYYSYLDEEVNYSNVSKELYLKYLLSLNKSMYDVYILLMNLYLELNQHEKAFNCIDEGFNFLLLKEFNGSIPDELDYCEIENRDIYRLIFNYADSLWMRNKTKEALEIFYTLIELNPNDNIGVRYSICGIFEGYLSTQYVWTVQDQNIENWFRENIIKYQKKVKGYKKMINYFKS